MTIREIRKEYDDEYVKLETKYKAKIEQELIKKGLFGLVKRVRDGKVGRLQVIIEFGGVIRVKFYPLTKSGEESKNASGLVWDVEAEYEPYNEEADK